MQLNSDDDANGDECDEDDDNDGIFDEADNCPTVAGLDQTDNDRDGAGDICDDDDDNDRVLDADDNCPLVENPDQNNADGDMLGDACDIDADDDGIENEMDNCVLVANLDQANSDADEIGDACDNCPEINNPDQTNSDRYSSIITPIDYVWRQLPDDATTVRYDVEEDYIGVDMGFAYDWFGQAVTQVDITPFGEVYTAIENDFNELAGSVVGYQAEYDFFDGGQVRHATIGDPGAQEFIVEYADVPLARSNVLISFQIVFFESGGGEIQCQNCRPFFDRPSLQGVFGPVEASLDGRSDEPFVAVDDGVSFTTDDNGDDGVGDECDLCPSVADADQADTDADLVGDACDNCAGVPNNDQAISMPMV